jgi:hypothetical protein
VKSTQQPPKRRDWRIIPTIVMLLFLVVGFGFSLASVLRHPPKRIRLHRANGLALLATRPHHHTLADTKGTSGKSASGEDAASGPHGSTSAGGGSSLEDEVMGQEEPAASEATDDDDDDEDENADGPAMTDENGDALDTANDGDDYESEGSTPTTVASTDDEETWGDDDEGAQGTEGSSEDEEGDETDVETAAAGSFSATPDQFFKSLTAATNTADEDGAPDEVESDEPASSAANAPKAAAVEPSSDPLLGGTSNDAMTDSSSGEE